jgi:apolipoprotein N-acyltransferase
MGCGCGEMIKKMTCYEHQKELAVKYAKAENVMVIIYITNEGQYQFMEASAPEAAAVHTIEFVSPLQ